MVSGPKPRLILQHSGADYDKFVIAPSRVASLPTFRVDRYSAWMHWALHPVSQLSPRPHASEVKVLVRGGLVTPLDLPSLSTSERELGTLACLRHGKTGLRVVRLVGWNSRMEWLRCEPARGLWWG